MSDMAVRYERRPISVDDYHRMAVAGIFAPDERVELLDGELIAVAPMNSHHAGAISAIDHALTIRFNGRATVRVQLPILLSNRSEPEPDVALIAPEPSEWRERHPLPGDFLLLIEVADTTRDYDLYSKAPLYARAGIADYWVVDVADRRVLVHREPAAGRYAVTRILHSGESLAPLAFPGDDFEVASFVGPAR